MYLKGSIWLFDEHKNLHFDDEINFSYVNHIIFESYILLLW